MNKADRLLWPHFVANASETGEADPMVDLVLSAQPATAKLDQRDSHRAGVNGCNPPCLCGHASLDYRGRSEMRSRSFEQIGRTAERDDHAAEDLRCTSRGERSLDPCHGFRFCAANASDQEHLRDQRARYLVEPRIPALAGKMVDRLLHFGG